MILETKRLILRNFQYNDLEALYEYRNDIECSKYQKWGNNSKEYLKNLIEVEKDKVINGEPIKLAVELKEINKLIGDICILFENKTIILGYTISYKYQRKGYGYEVIKALVKKLFELFNDYEIVCAVNPNNEASKMLLSKLNFIKRGYLRSLDSVIYSMKYTDYKLNMINYEVVKLAN